MNVEVARIHALRAADACRVFVCVVLHDKLFQPAVILRCGMDMKRTPLLQLDVLRGNLCAIGNHQMHFAAHDIEHFILTLAANDEVAATQRYPIVGVTAFDDLAVLSLRGELHLFLCLVPRAGVECFTVCRCT